MTATGAVVAGVIVLTLQSWWVVAGVLVLHALATIAVAACALHYAGQSHDKPDPLSEARLERERARRCSRPTSARAPQRDRRPETFD